MLGLLLHGTDINSPGCPFVILEHIKDMLKHGNIHALPTSIKETKEQLHAETLGTMPPYHEGQVFSNFYLAQSAVQALRECCRPSRFEQFTALCTVSGH